MKTALFPGSFDPITKGHLSVLKDASQLFDKVYLVIMTNTHKHYLFTPEERTALAMSSIEELGIENVEVLCRPASITATLAEQLQVNALIRGVRNEKDFNYENEIASLNRKLAPEIPTILLFTDENQRLISSSLLKEVAKLQGELSPFLTKTVSEALKEKMKDYEE
ncbi:MAG: pantetheine-phosphate adenylyltransferase [Lactobacillus sp.]|nr:pantetheine-phosphate adenylyltransferase [Lactobacillus sp.]